MGLGQSRLIGRCVFMSTKKIKTIRKAAADGGNGETKMWFEGDSEGLAIPTAQIKVINKNEKGSFLSRKEVTIDNVHEHLDITFITSKCFEKTNERFLIGKKTLTKQGLHIVETDIHESEKFGSEVVARTILAGLVVDSIRQNGLDNTKIQAKYDLGLCLPFIEVDPERFQTNSERFIGTHELRFHFPDGRTIDLSIEIEFAMTLPESAIAGYSIVYERNGELKEYDLKVLKGEEITTETKNLLDVPLLVPDIGAGTIDCAVMVGVEFDFENSYGEEIGTKLTIERIRHAWNEEYPNDKINSLVQFTEIYSNEENFNAVRLRNFSEPYLEDDANKIASIIKNKVKHMPSNTLVVLCGGGSILFKNALLEKLEKIADRLIFKKDGKFANAEGLIIFATHPAFEEIKKNYLAAV